MTESSHTSQTPMAQYLESKNELFKKRLERYKHLVETEQDMVLIEGQWLLDLRDDDFNNGENLSGQKVIQPI